MEDQGLPCEHHVYGAGMRSRVRVRRSALLLAALSAGAACSGSDGGTSTLATSLPDTTSTSARLDGSTAAAPNEGTDTTAEPQPTVDPLACPASGAVPEGVAGSLTAAACATEGARSKRFDTVGANGSGSSFGARGAVDQVDGRADIVLRRRGNDVIHYLVDASTVYVTSTDPAVTAVLPQDRPWVVGTAEEFARVGIAPQAADPVPVHLLLLGATDVVQQGPLYSFSVDPAAVLSNAPPGRIGDLAQVAPLDGAGLALTGSAQLDDAGRIGTVNINGVAGTGDVRWVARFDGYDEPVAVSPPPAPGTVDLGQVPDLAVVLASVVV